MLPLPLLVFVATTIARIDDTSVAAIDIIAIVTVTSGKIIGHNFLPPSVLIGCCENVDSQQDIQYCRIIHYCCCCHRFVQGGGAVSCFLLGLRFAV